MHEGRMGGYIMTTHLEALCIPVLYFSYGCHLTQIVREFI